MNKTCKERRKKIDREELMNFIYAQKYKMIREYNLNQYILHGCANCYKCLFETTNNTPY